MRLKFVVLDPTGEGAAQQGALAPRLPALRGKRMGVLWNEKPNGDVVLSRLQEILATRYELSQVTWRQKTSSQRISPHALEDLVRESDFILNALAD